MSEDTVWNPYWPTWGDQGRYVEVERDDGTVVRGHLIVEDWYPDGEGEEIPCWAIETGSGEVNFSIHKRWRFLV